MARKKKRPAMDKSRVSERRTKDYRPPTGGRRVRKNMDMDQDKLDTAKRILGARTETEAVDGALDLVAFQGEVISGIERALAAGGLADMYETERAEVRDRQ